MEHSPLPIIDLTALGGAPATRRHMLAKLGRAARDIGFFYLTGHGLSEAQQQETLALAARFFALPEQEKRAVQMVHSPHFRGYNQVGAELTRQRPDRREQFDIMNETPALAKDEIHAPWQRLIGPNQWPAALPEMKAQLLAWQERLSDITLTLLDAFAEVLAQPQGVFDASIRGKPYQHMKLIHYPGREAGSSSQGVGAHKDPGYLTLVMQDDHSGLEVETADGWIPAPPLPGALVVNIGELLELASNGYLKATLHRVVSPPLGVSRLSCAFFMAARLDATVPLLTLSPSLAAQAQGPESDPANPLFYQVGENVLKGRLRSHPDVAARHYTADPASANEPMAGGQTTSSERREPQPA
ncbi:2-oxobutyrate oxidase [Aeromonas salmonicida]|uniref:Dioxygenase domain protein n=1 Tax=Aeromonas salmonicida subsp. pectinolytica 34mel TaxID=1324960 RepID=T0PJ18_AERSA|nr:2-oxoglutarate and iron-dependent oxygenase domain-containing protein [Aeromonas salmonicida]ATP09441.1 dioxygenase domain protein [Aeromonas salmonicida subsp. pectinolytica 34mel]EQC02711.1 2OG-Fe(II) oxygenase [Aeromonas salmonicida subsp. pectinolytica 34mel]TNI11575.1 2-oxobutyrate oxidase [Aeromonas salmonicida]HEH9393818.1 isopenicillin N synthase family oxygenase [Aeromonas salmonicida]